MKGKIILKSLGMAAAALLANTSHGAQIQPVLGSEAFTQQPQVMPELPSIAPNTQDGADKMWGHESHYSHRSHSSHQSHQSHYSSSW